VRTRHGIRQWSQSSSGRALVLGAALLALAACKSEQSSERERKEADRRRCNLVAQCTFGTPKTDFGGTRAFGEEIDLAAEFPVECPAEAAGAFRVSSTFPTDSPTWLCDSKISG
jgi:hypothetical protein